MTDKFFGGVKAGSVDVSHTIVLRKTTDSTETTGKAASDMTLSYLRQGGTRTGVAATDLAAVNSAHSDGGVKEVDSTNMPGSYRVDWPDAAFAAAADWVQLTVKVSGSFVFNERLAIASHVLDDVVEGSTTLRQMLRGYASALLAKVSGMSSNAPKFRDLADSKDRITATTDSSGNRTAVTLDLT